MLMETGDLTFQLSPSYQAPPPPGGGGGGGGTDLEIHFLHPKKRLRNRTAIRSRNGPQDPFNTLELTTRVDKHDHSPSVPSLIYTVTMSVSDIIN